VPDGQSVKVVTDGNQTVIASHVIIAMPPPLVSQITFNPPLEIINPNLAQARQKLSSSMVPGCKVKGND